MDNFGEIEVIEVIEEIEEIDLRPFSVSFKGPKGESESLRGGLRAIGYIDDIFSPLSIELGGGLGVEGGDVPILSNPQID